MLKFGYEQYTKAYFHVTDLSIIGDEGFCIGAPKLPHSHIWSGWFGSRVVSVLDSGVESQESNRSRDAAG